MPRKRYPKPGAKYFGDCPELAINNIYIPPILEKVFGNEGISLSEHAKNKLARNIEEFDKLREQLIEIPTKTELVNRLNNIIKKTKAYIESIESNGNFHGKAKVVYDELSSLDDYTIFELKAQGWDGAVHYSENDRESIDALIGYAEAAIRIIKSEKAGRITTIEPRIIKTIIEVYEKYGGDGRKAGVSSSPLRPKEQRYDGPFFRIVEGIFNGLHITYSSNESLGKMIQRAASDLNKGR